jgi:hypothetical protein
MRCVIEIRMDNAAFDGPDGGCELARILRKIASDVAERDVRFDVINRLRDINGNKVGSYQILSD